MCHALVAIFILGLKGPHNLMDMQFLDSCPTEPPKACWLKFEEQVGPYDRTLKWHGVCVDDKKHQVYKGRLAPMVES